MRLISHCLTPVNQLSGILSLIGFSNLSTPSPFSALPPVIFHEASPKAISGRTSYIRVRLEFLRYPHLITPFQRTCVRPSMEFYLHFSLDMDRSLGFGSIAYDFFALFRLALASAPCLKHLTLPHTITRRTILQKVPDHTLTCSRCL